MSKAMNGFWRAPFLGPRYLIQLAFLVSILFAAAQLAGLREFTSILNGTVGSVGMSWQFAAFLGFVYLGLYLAFVLLAPILVLAAGLLAVWNAFFPLARLSTLPDESPKNSAAKDPLRYLALHNRSRD